MKDFYNALAPMYHLIYDDWDKSIAEQGDQLSHIINENWDPVQRVLDVSCGIGTQSLALASKGFSVTGSDLSEKAIERAKKDSETRGLKIGFSVCDMRDVHEHHGGGFDVVLTADNSVPHLLNEDEITTAFLQMYACLKTGGGCVVTMRDYLVEKKGSDMFKPYGVRYFQGRRYVLFQLWDFVDDCYDLSLYIVEENISKSKVQTHVFKTRYFAVSIPTIMSIMRDVGFNQVMRLNDVFYQPVIIATK